MRSALCVLGLLVGSSFCAWAAADTDPTGFTTVIDFPADPAPSQINSDTQLNLLGGVLGDFFFAGSPAGGDSNVEVNIKGGSTGSFFRASEGSTVNLLSGEIASFFTAGNGSTTNIRRGEVGPFFSAEAGSTVNIAGSDLFGAMEALPGSELNLFGLDFSFGGTPIDLALGETLTLAGRDALLTGTLVDGSPLELDLVSVDLPQITNFFSPSATINLTRVLPGDASGDGFVGLSDYNAWAAGFGEITDQFGGADTNYDGRVDAADYTVWRDNLSAGSLPSAAIVPEPSTLATAAMALATVARGFKQRSN